MTGCEVLAIKDGKTFLFKVRHDGMDLEEFILDNRVLAIDFNELGKYISDWWYSDNGAPRIPIGGGEPNLDSEIDTKYKEGYIADFIDNDPIDNTEDDFWTRLGKVQAEIEGKGDDGYLCSYMDYQVLIDYDNKKVLSSTISEMSIIEEEEEE